MFSCSSFRKEGVEWVISCSNCLVGRHLTIRLDAMFKAIKFPAGVADLATGLPNVDWDALTLKERLCYTKMDDEKYPIQSSRLSKWITILRRRRERGMRVLARRDPDTKWSSPLRSPCKVSYSEVVPDWSAEVGLNLWLVEAQEVPQTNLVAKALFATATAYRSKENRKQLLGRFHDCVKIENSHSLRLFEIYQA